MINIENIDERKPHTVSELICIKCGKRWIGVRPSDLLLKEIDCPNCGAGFVIETGQDLDTLQNFPCHDCRHNVAGRCKLRIQDADACEYYEKGDDHG